MSLKLHLLVIDPQNDFVDPNGSLYVTGAEQDMDRVALLVERLKGKLTDIHVTLDSHRKVDISHPIWWKDTAGNHPAPFTIISAADVSSGKWTTTQPGAYARSREYLLELERNQRYPHVIWPEHCLIGDEGHNVWKNLSGAIHEWEDRFAMADFVTKGSNPWTEHFSAVQAEVPDPEDPSTQVNTRLISTLEEADVILLAGEARSHCLANTVRDIAKNFGQAHYVEKMVLLTDATSDVADPPGTTMFTDMGKKFVADLTAMGMKTATTTDFLA
jgi:nicotinamidase-related amidase